MDIVNVVTVGELQRALLAYDPSRGIVIGQIKDGSEGPGIVRDVGSKIGFAVPTESEEPIYLVAYACEFEPRHPDITLGE